MEELHIFNTTDVHGELNEGFFEAVQMMDDYPSTLRIDNGDFFAGRPFATFGRVKGGKSPLVQTANEVSYDAMIPGNHDFDYGIDWLKKQVKYLDAEYLCANVYDADWDLLFKPYKVIEKAGMKIGVVGLVTEALNQLIPVKYHSDIRTRPVNDVLPAVLKELSYCDLIIVAYHGGLTRDPNTGAVWSYSSLEDNAYEIVSRYPEIDVLICGHQHFINSGTHPELGTAIVQPGSHGQAMGHQMVVDGQIVSNQIHEFSDTEDHYPKGYYKWLSKPIDLEKVDKYISKRYKADLIFVDYHAATIGELAAEMDHPFPLGRYLIKGFELIELGLIEGVKDELKLYSVIASPGLIPTTYLVKDYLINLFSDVMTEISVK